MASVRFTVDSPRTPQEVVAALTDFTDRRPALWPSIDGSVYAVHEVGDGVAEATEGSAVLGGICPGALRVGGRARARHVGRLELWPPGGTWQATISPGVSGGSRIEVTRDRRAKVFRARILQSMMRVVGARLLAADLAKAPAVTGEAIG